MKDEYKTKNQLIQELKQLRQLNSELQHKETKYKNLVEELHLFKSIIESSPEAIAISDPDGRLVYINPAHEKLFSRSLVEARQLNYRKYYPSESIEVLNNEVATSLKNGKSWEGELEVMDSKGRHFTLWEHAGSIMDESGKMCYGFGIMHDSSEKKKGRELLRNQRELAIALSMTNDLHEMFREILNAACQIEEIDCGGVYLVDHDKQSIELAHQEGLPDEFIKGASYYDFDSPQAEFVFSQNPYYGKYIDLKSISKKQCQREGLKAVAVIPVKFNKEVVALLNLASHDHDNIPVIARDALEAIASQVGGAISRMKNQLSVVKNQQNLQNLIDSMNDFLFIVDRNGVIIYTNPVVEERLGYSREQILNMTITDFHPKERREEAISIISEMVAGKVEICPIPLMANDGTIIPVETKVTKGYWNDEEVLFGVSRDITDRIHAEKAFKKAHDQLEQTVKIRTEDLVNANNKLKLEIRDRKKAEKEAERYIDELTFLSEAAFDFATLPIDEDFYQFTGRKLKEITGNSIVLINAFDQKNNTFHLKYFGGLGRHTDDVIKLLGKKLHGYTVTLNNEEAKIDLLKGKLVLVKGRLFELSFGEIPRAVCNSIEKILGIGPLYTIGMARKNVLYGNVVIVTRDKEQLINQNIIEAFINQVTVAYERKRAEDALKMNEEKFRTIFEQSPIAVELYDATGLLVDTNPECLYLLGVDHVDDVKGFNLFEYQNINNKYGERLIAGETVKYEIEFDFEFVRKNNLFKTSKSGRCYFYVIINPLMINSDHPYGYLVLIQDITRRKEYEAELLKAEKLRSIGVLAGGIAHDFNNLLTGIIGNVSLAKLYEDSWDDVIELLDEAENASFRARNLTQQLLTFSKGGTPVKKLMSIQNLVKDTAIFVLRGAKSRCELSFPEDLWSVEMDEGQISQVIQNLVINADHAMPNGGEISIECENVKIQDDDTKSMKKGNYVKISFRDSGIGISEKNLKRIFDPYFTTKKNGNGLGLTTAYAIIQKHNGYLTAWSELGKGSCFSIYLPASTEKPDKSTVPPAEEFKANGKILVMDDEEAVRKIAGKMFKKMGFEVDFAPDGSRAIKMYADAMRTKIPYAAVLMDLTIPGGMGGKQAIKELLKIDPAAKAIVTSGYSNDVSISEFREYGFKDMITKPYQFNDLQEVMKRILALSE